MPDVISYETEYGLIHVEVSDRVRSTTRGGERDEVTKVRARFDEATAIVEAVGNAIVAKVNKMIDSPDEVSVELGIKFTAEAGAIIAKASTEGALRLTMNWKKNINKIQPDNA